MFCPDDITRLYGGLWAIDPRTGGVLFHWLGRATTPRAGVHAGDGRPRREGRGYELTPQGVAVVPLIGTITKGGSAFTGFPGTLTIRGRLRAAVDDPHVKAVLLLIDSPGGAMAGVTDLADDVRSTAKRKPIHAFIEDAGLAAAYLVGSQAQRLTANAGAFIGGIGTYTVFVDSSAAAGRAGVKVHVVRAGAYKGIGTPGEKVTDDQLADCRRVVNECNRLVLNHVAAGRGLNRKSIERIADGRVHVGAKALKLNLVDAIGTLDDAIAGVARAAGVIVDRAPRAARGVSDTAQRARRSDADRLAQLRRTMPKATADFLLDCLLHERSADESMQLYTLHLESRIEAMSETRWHNKGSGRRG